MNRLGMNRLGIASVIALIVAIISFFIYLIGTYGDMAFGDVPMWVIFVLFGGLMFGSKA